MTFHSIVFSHLSKRQDSPDGFLKHRLQSFPFSRSRVGPRMCISNKFPGDVDAEGHTLRSTALDPWSSMMNQWVWILVPALP